MEDQKWQHNVKCKRKRFKTLTLFYILIFIYFIYLKKTISKLLIFTLNHLSKQKTLPLQGNMMVNSTVAENKAKIKCKKSIKR